MNVNTRRTHAPKIVSASLRWGALAEPRPRICRVAVAAILVVGLSNVVLPAAFGDAGANTAVSYEAIDLGVLQGDAASIAFGINTRGQIVGISSPNLR